MCIKKLDNENKRLSTENKLLNIRLDSISEILGIQEADITKVSGWEALLKGACCSLQGDICRFLYIIFQRCGEEAGCVRGLLTLWREKVFVLLVQRKMEEIQNASKLDDAQKKVRLKTCINIGSIMVIFYFSLCVQGLSLAEAAEKSERSGQLLSHALTDKDAQLQLQQKKCQVYPGTGHWHEFLYACREESESCMAQDIACCSMESRQLPSSTTGA